MHDKDHNQAPRYHIEKVDIDRDALKQLFKPFDEIKLARNNEPFLIVRAPYDPEVNAGLKGMRGRFMPTSKTWRVSIGQYQALLALAPKIHEIAAAEWHDAINSVAREEANDKRILVKKEDLGFYLEGHLVVVNGTEYVVTHIGRPQQRTDGVKFPLFLSRPEALEAPVSSSFTAGGNEDDGRVPEDYIPFEGYTDPE